MKTRQLTIIGIIIAIAVSIAFVFLAYNQEIKLVTGMMTSDEKPHPSIVSDPVCFVVDKTRSDNIGSGVTMDTCISLKQFEEMGCTKPMLEHILRYSNLLDYEVDGPVYLEWAGLPNGISQKEFDECFNAILEKRPILDSRQNDEPKTPVPEPERDPIPEGNYVDKNTYVYSIKDAESYLNYTLSTPYIPEGTELEKIKISNDRSKATIYYSNGLEVSFHPMGRNFNNTYYIENPARPEGKVFYDFGGTFAEGVQVTDPFYSVITIHRADRIYIKATMETNLDELLRMIEPMNLDVPYVPYTPDPDYVMNEPEPKPIPEPEPESVYNPYETRCGSAGIPYIPENWQSLGLHPTDNDWENLGRHIIKQEFYEQLKQKDIIFKPACFGVYTGFALTSYPPNFSMCTVVTELDGSKIYLEGSVHEFDVTFFEMNKEIPYLCDENHNGCLCGIENEN